MKTSLLTQSESFIEHFLLLNFLFYPWAFEILIFGIDKKTTIVTEASDLAVSDFVSLYLGVINECL